MKKETIERAWTNIEDCYVKEAENYGKRNIFKGLSYVAAGFIGVLLLTFASISVATAAGVPEAYNLMYAFNKSLALNLVPVNTSCDSNGIRMNVDSVYIHEDTADVYVSMQDLEGQRLDATIDLFDSYDIGTPNDSIGTCSFVSFDEEQQKAYFLITVQNMHGEKIKSGNMTFSISTFLARKQNTNRNLDEIDLGTIEEAGETMTDVSIRGGKHDDTTVFLAHNEAQTFSPANGVTVYAYGLIDGRLHVQVLYDDIANTDNHGFIFLQNTAGERLFPDTNPTFWDENHKGSYEEYIFPAYGSELSAMQVFGEFTTCSGKVDGNWRVTFPIQ